MSLPALIQPNEEEYGYPDSENYYKYHIDSNAYHSKQKMIRYK